MTLPGLDIQISTRIRSLTHLRHDIGYYTHCKIVGVKNFVFRNVYCYHGTRLFSQIGCHPTCLSLQLPGTSKSARSYSKARLSVKFLSSWWMGRREGTLKSVWLRYVYTGSKEVLPVLSLHGTHVIGKRALMRQNEAELNSSLMTGNSMTSKDKYRSLHFLSYHQTALSNSPLPYILPTCEQILPAGV